MATEGGTQVVQNPTLKIDKVEHSLVTLWLFALRTDRLYAFHVIFDQRTVYGILSMCDSSIG